MREYFLRSLYVVIALAFAPFIYGEEEAGIGITTKDGVIEIHAGGLISEYVPADAQILRPYFKNLKTLSGVQVTRPYPVVAGVNDDHETMHPGLWLAFGDMNGVDFWRNKGNVGPGVFAPANYPDNRRAAFMQEYEYKADEGPIATESRLLMLNKSQEGLLIDWISGFRPTGDELVFGDQEEMGLGVRMRKELSVEFGNGAIRNSEGGVNEAGVWGKAADWCSYSGVIDGRRVGIVIMPHPDNFRRCWFHARDYGFVAANPFGRKAMTGGEESKVVVKKGETLQLRFGVLVFDAAPDDMEVEARAYKHYTESSN